MTALRRRFPQSHIRWVVNQGYADLLHGHPDLDEVLVFDRGAARGGLLRGARAYAGLADEIRRLRPDLVIDLQGLFRTGLLALASGAARRVGLSTAREGAVWFYTDVVPVADFEAIHAVDRLWLIAEALGAAGPPKEFRLVLPDEAPAVGQRAAGRPAAAVAGRRPRLALADQALAAGILRRAGPPGAGPIRRDRRVRRRRRRGAAGRRHCRPADGADVATSPAGRACRS